MSFYFDTIGPYVVLMHSKCKAPLIAVSSTSKYSSSLDGLYIYKILNKYKLDLEDNRLKIIGVDEV